MSWFVGLMAALASTAFFLAMRELLGPSTGSVVALIASAPIGAIIGCILHD